MLASWSRIRNSGPCPDASLHTLITPKSQNLNKEISAAAACSPDGQRLACGAMDGTVSVFDVASGKHLSNLPGHFKPVRSLQFLPGVEGWNIDRHGACLA